MAIKLNVLRRTRKKFALTQFDICYYAGVSDISYRYWEKCIRQPKEEHMDRLNKLFNVLEQQYEGEVTREKSLEILEREFGNA